MSETVTPLHERRFVPTQQRAATLAPSTFNEADRTVEVVWTTGARVRRFDFWSGQSYEEELLVTPDAVDMSRLEAGAPVLNTHSACSLADQIGVVDRAWIDGGEGRATLRLSDREDVAGIVADIRAGIIRNISVGYNVTRFEVTQPRDRADGGTVPLYRAVDWQPAEISFVPIPADAQAGTRSEQSHGVECEFITRAAAQPLETPPMPEIMEQGGTTPAATPDTPAIDHAARAADITDLCVRHGAAHLAAGLIRNGSTVDAARAAVLDDLARRDAASGGHRNVSVEVTRDAEDTRRAGVEQAILHRLDPRTKLDDNGRQFRGMSLLELGRDNLEHMGISTRGFERMELAGQMLVKRDGPGMMTSGDFTNILANVANKRLRNAYDENPGSYGVWARRAPNAPDFKALNVTQLSGAPDLLQTNEHGEFKYGSMTDSGETYQVLTYGRIVSLTRQAIVNDDLRAFDRMIAAYGFAARRLENRLVYSQLTANGKLADGTALFDAGHKNLATGANSVLAFQALTTARAAMRVQKGLAGEELNIAPSFLIVPAALEQSAYQLTSNQYVPAKQSDTNEFRTGGRTALEVVVDPVLDGNSATAWYLAAATSQVDTVEYCYLDGAEGPVIESEMGFEVDGVSWKCRLDFAAKAIDYRGLFKAVGA